MLGNPKNIGLGCEGCSLPKHLCSCNKKENFFIENFNITFIIIVASLIIFAYFCINLKKS